MDKYIVYYQKSKDEDDKECWSVYAGKVGVKPSFSRSFTGDGAKDEAKSLCDLIKFDPHKFGL